MQPVHPLSFFIQHYTAVPLFLGTDIPIIPVSVPITFYFMLVPYFLWALSCQLLSHSPYLTHYSFMHDHSDIKFIHEVESPLLIEIQIVYTNSNFRSDLTTSQGDPSDNPS